MQKKDVVIVTGSAGRIGSRIVDRLSSDFSVVGLEQAKVEQKGREEKKICVDLADDQSVVEAFHQIHETYGNRIASVIHLAAYYSFKDKFSSAYDQVTVQGTKRLIDVLGSFEVEQFLFTSSMLVHAPSHPGKAITESWPILATWGYPISKVQTEKLLHETRDSFPILILRVAGVYDDLCHSIPISNQIQRIYEKKLEARFFPGNIHHGAAFVHMDDLVDALELAVRKRAQLPQETTLLIGEPTTLSYDQTQRAISKLIYHKEFTTFRIPKFLAKLGAFLKCHLPFSPDPFIQPWMIQYADDHYELNIERAHKILGWSPKKSLERTLPKMIEALLKDPEKWYQINGLH
jgi:nucleoside-diphosphate-sugar epimerase